MRSIDLIEIRRGKALAETVCEYANVIEAINEDRGKLQEENKYLKDKINELENVIKTAANSGESDGTD